MHRAGLVHDVQAEQHLAHDAASFVRRQALLFGQHLVQADPRLIADRNKAFLARLLQLIQILQIRMPLPSGGGQDRFRGRMPLFGASFGVKKMQRDDVP